MVTPRTEKAYEKHAWILLFVIGIFSLIGAIPFLLGIDLDPTFEEGIIGMKLSALKASNPRFFDFYTFYDRVVGLLFLAIALPSIVISATAYKRGEKWAWYPLWVIPVVFIGIIATELGVGGESSSVLAGNLALLIVYLMGLLLPYRKFFPKRAVMRT